MSKDTIAKVKNTLKKQKENYPNQKKGIPQSAEHKKKLSEVRTGRKASEATKKKMSKTRKGRPAHNKGTKHTEATKKKIRSYKHTEKAKRRISAAGQRISYDEWEDFACEQKYCPKFDEACRESCRSKYGHRCFMCGKRQVDNKTKTGKVRKLSVHHVNMDKAQGCESNWKLVPLCMKCHPVTHNDEMIARLGYLIKEE